MPPRPFHAPEYPKCKHILREKPNYPITEDVFRNMQYDTDVLPLFELKIDSYKRMKHGSFGRNEFLNCRWREYLRLVNKNTRPPFTFPRVDDLHFANYLVRYNPSETIRNRSNSRIQLKNGPGLDEYGQLPIPDDMHLRKTEIHTKFTPRKKKEEVLKEKSK